MTSRKKTPAKKAATKKKASTVVKKKAAPKKKAAKKPATAKKKAMSNAKADLAGTIQTTIKATIDNYVNSREMNNKESVEERFEGLSREVINQKLSGVITICEKTFKTPENKYKTYVCLELGADDLVDAINERLTKEESLRIDYDYEKFKEEFNKEMEKLEKSN